MSCDRITRQIPREVIDNVSKVCVNLLKEQPKKIVYKVEVDPVFFDEINQIKATILSAKGKQSSLVGRGAGLFALSYVHISNDDARHFFWCYISREIY